MKLANLGTLALALALAFGASSRAAAEWISISDFTGLGTTVNPNTIGGWFLNGSGGWVTGSSSPGNTGNFTIQDSPAPGGRHVGVASLTTSDLRYARLSLPTEARIANSETGTLFFRFYAESGSTFAKVQVGLSSSASPTSTRNVGAAFRVETESNGIFYGLDSDSAATSNTGKTRGTWHNVWFVIDNVNDKIDFYMTTGNQDATSATPLVSEGNFNNSTTSTLQTLLIVVNSAGSGTVAGVIFRIDDFYMTSGTDLTNPVPEPASHGALLLGGMVLAPWLRRKIRGEGA